MIAKDQVFLPVQTREYLPAVTSVDVAQVKDGVIWSDKIIPVVRQTFIHPAKGFKAACSFPRSKACAD